MNPWYRVHEGNITGGLRNPEKDKINFNRGIVTLSCFRILLGQDFTITQRLFYMFRWIVDNYCFMSVVSKIG